MIKDASANRKTKTAQTKFFTKTASATRLHYLVFLFLNASSFQLWCSDSSKTQCSAYSSLFFRERLKVEGILPEQFTCCLDNSRKLVWRCVQDFQELSNTWHFGKNERKRPSRFHVPELYIAPGSSRLFELHINCKQVITNM